MTVNGWIPVDRTNLKTPYPNVYAIGDVNSVGTPKAGVFAEGAAKIVAPSGTYTKASVDLVIDKQYFGSSRESRWFK